MKGIVLAGGTGSRLFPTTIGVSKHLLPIYDKPMIYYPLSVLMLAGIRDVLIISTPLDIDAYRRLLSDGSQIGINIKYAVQLKAKGIPDAFIVGEEFIGSDSVCLILGDNIFYGQDFTNKLRAASELKNGAALFCCRVGDPERFGVVTLDSQNRAIRIDEKPNKPSSEFAVTGLYFYGNEVIEKAKKLKPSIRGEVEITDLNNEFIKAGDVNVNLLGRGFTWMDAGTPDALVSASNIVQSIQIQQATKIACLEEIALKNHWVSKTALQTNSQHLQNTDYGCYVKKLAEIQ